MSRVSDENLRGIPMRPYDIIWEGVVVLSIVTVIIVFLAILFPAPDYPPVNGEAVATRQPLAYVKTTATILAGKSSLQEYGPPYTADYANAQRIGQFAPATWSGVPLPIDARRDLVLKPLGRVAILNSQVATALSAYQAASQNQQQAWANAYLAALDKAAMADGRVRVAPGNYGPVPVLMEGMLDLGRAGLLEGALESVAHGGRLPYSTNHTYSLLYFQDDVDHEVAQSLNLLGEQWGVSNETGSFPGAWWLWPYTFIYQIPGWSDSPNIDLIAIVLMLVVFVVLLFIPFIPLLNRLPYWLGIYKIIWGDWYRRYPSGLPPGDAEATAETGSERVGQ